MKPPTHHPWLVRFAAVVVAACAGLASAGEIEQRVRNTLVAPARIIEFGDDIHLSSKQRDRVLSLGNLYQVRVDRLHADAGEAAERLVTALEREPIDKARALDELAKLNAIEAEIKRLHLELWIECNAELRPLQRKQAIELANKAAAPAADAEPPR